MKTKIILLVLILYIILSINVFASRSEDITPKEYVITINNVNQEEIQNIEILYPTSLGFYYAKNNENREWITDTTFGNKYNNYTDAEIIPTLSTDEIDEIAKCYYNSIKRKVEPSLINGYWLNGENYDIQKYAILSDAKVQYNNNYIEITYPPSYWKIDDNIVGDGSRTIIRIVKDDNTIIFSKLFKSKLITWVDEYTKGTEYNEIMSVKDKVAYFEVDYTNITNDFEVKEIFKEDIKNNNSEEEILKTEKENLDEENEVIKDENKGNTVIFPITVIIIFIGIILVIFVYKKI